MKREHIAKNIPKLYIFHAIRGAMVTMPIITLFFQENGLSMQDIFVLQAIFSITAILFEIPSGYLSDKMGHKKALVLGAFISTLGMVVYALSFDFWTILVAEVILGVGFAFFSGADSALLYNSLINTKQEREHKKIESKVISINNFSQAIGGIIGGILGAVSLRWPFILEAIIMFMAIPVTMSLSEPVVQKAKGASQNFWLGVKRVVSYSLHGHKKLKWILIYSGVINTSTLVWVWFMQPYWQMVDVPIVMFGILWALLNVSISVFVLFAYRFEELLGLRKALVSLVVLVGIAYALLGAYPSLFILPIILLFYFVRAVQQPILRDYVHRIIESDIRATVLSIQSLVGRLMFVILGPILGYASDVLSLPQALIISAATFLLIGAVPLFFLHKHKAL